MSSKRKMSSNCPGFESLECQVKSENTLDGDSADLLMENDMQTPDLCADPLNISGDDPADNNLENLLNFAQEMTGGSSEIVNPCSSKSSDKKDLTSENVNYIEEEDAYVEPIIQDSDSDFVASEFNESDEDFGDDEEYGEDDEEYGEDDEDYSDIEQNISKKQKQKPKTKKSSSHTSDLDESQDSDPIVCLGVRPYELESAPLFRNLPSDTQRKYNNTWCEFLELHNIRLGHPPTFTQFYDFMEMKLKEGKGQTTVKAYYTHLSMGLLQIYSRKLPPFKEILK